MYRIFGNRFSAWSVVLIHQCPFSWLQDYDYLFKLNPLKHELGLKWIFECNKWSNLANYYAKEIQIFLHNTIWTCKLSNLTWLFNAMLRLTSKKNRKKVSKVLQILLQLNCNRLEISQKNIVTLHCTLCGGYVVDKFCVPFVSPDSLVSFRTLCGVCGVFSSCTTWWLELSGQW